VAWLRADAGLRIMLDEATGFHDNHEEGRFVIESSHGRVRWAVIVEPSAEYVSLIVVTAYPLD
jgi:hypothetical protein